MRILSGIQPGGTLHLGNYFGMMQPAIALHKRCLGFYPQMMRMIADKKKKSA
jgi:tryptophanyl-tRNA synthetase